MRLREDKKRENGNHSENSESELCFSAVTFFIMTVKTQTFWNNGDITPPPSSEDEDSLTSLEQLIKIYIRKTTSSLRKKCFAADQLNLTNLSTDTLGAWADKIARLYNKVDEHYSNLKSRGYYTQVEYITHAGAYTMAGNSFLRLMRARDRCIQMFEQCFSFIPTILADPPTPSQDLILHHGEKQIPEPVQATQPKPVQIQITLPTSDRSEFLAQMITDANQPVAKSNETNLIKSSAKHGEKMRSQSSTHSEQIFLVVNSVREKSSLPNDSQAIRSETRSSFTMSNDADRDGNRQVNTPWSSSPSSSTSQTTKTSLPPPIDKPNLADPLVRRRLAEDVTAML